MGDIRRDPLPVFCFKVQLSINKGQDADLFFKSVSGLKYETEVVPVREGGVNDTTWALLGATKWNNIVLKQGFTGDSKIFEWRRDWMTGKARTRVDGDIFLLDTSLKVKAHWKFKNGWPCKWEISEFDASKSELAIETLEIAHEGISDYTET